MIEHQTETASTVAVNRAPVPVLYIIDEICQLGGAERILLNMIRLLPRERFAPELLTFRINPQLGIFDFFPCPLHVFPLRRTWDFGALRTALRIRRLVRDRGFELVHTFFETSDIWAGPLARLSGAKVLISSRRDMGILRSRKHHLAYRVANRFYDQVQTVSEQVRRYCIDQDRLAPEKVLTLYNGVDVTRLEAAEAFPAARIIPALHGSSHLVTTVAHVRKVKGIDVLLRSAAIVHARFPGAAFVVLGDVREPEHFRELLELRRTLGLENVVHFPGPVDSVPEWLSASDVFFLPSRSEGLSNALLEATTCGVPCVATAVGGNPELLQHGDNGWLVPVEDPAAAAEAILQLLENPPLARRTGDRSRAAVKQRFTTDSMMRELTRSYECLLHKLPSAQR